MTSEKLEKFRSILKEHKINAYVQPKGDAHFSEYPAELNERIKFISGFSGSAGLALITEKEAYLWTDSRYWLQAEKELEKGWELKKQQAGTPPWFEWIAQTYSSQNFVVGYDPKLLSQVTQDTRSKFFETKQIGFVGIESNLVDALWTDRPSEPQAKLIVHDESYTGLNVTQKLEQVGKVVLKSGAKHHLVPILEQIAWVLNIRGRDNDYNPVFISYLLLNFSQNEETITSSGTLFVRKDKVPEEVEKHLKHYNIELRDYDDIINSLKQLNDKILISKSETNSYIYSNITDKSLIIDVSGESPIEELKAVKNDRERQGIRECHVRDGAALVRYISWLENQLNVHHNSELTEYSAAMQLKGFRAEQQFNQGLSFVAISSIGANGAIVHYHPEEHKAALLNNKEIYLIDSGGQYLDGTTDVTRTLHFTEATDEQRDCYTRVLLGNLDVERVIMPANGRISGADIDILARRRLWEAGLDYGHGTGHGVGYFLNVHEGPLGISKYRSYSFKPGMIVTNEPGYYKDGEFGIRIENILEIVELHEGKWLGFKNLTLFPYEKRLIKQDLLEKKDVEYINNYHQRVFETLSPLLKEQNDPLALEWLEKATSPL